MKLFANSAVLMLGILFLLSVGLCAAEFQTIPDVILGVNQPGPASSSEYDPAYPWMLSDADIQLLKSGGVNTIRIPVYPKQIGLNGEKLTWNTGDSFNVDELNTLTPDWQLLDATLEQFQRNGITPYICPHPYPLVNWMTIYIPEDAERCLWYTSLIVKHVASKYGDNVIYGWYENIWKNSMQPWYTGVYRHSLSAQFPAEWHRMLEKMYKGDIKSLNKAWKTNYSSFDEAPVWDMGTIDGIPDEAFSTRRTYDLRTAIDLLSRERLISWREELRRLSPGALWMSACLHDGFDGYYDARAGNPPACNWSIRTHAITSDVLAADNYQHPRKLMTAYRTVAKIAAEEGKSFAAVEINAQSTAGFDALAEVGGPIKGALVWCGREDAFGLIKSDGTLREDSFNAMKKLFDLLKQKDSKTTKYKKGRVYVYYPEETYRSAVLKASFLDAYDHVCDNIAPTDFEPVLTNELNKIPKGNPIYVLEKNLPSKAIKIINKLGDQVISPYAYFVDENGNRVERSYYASDFYDDLLKSKYGTELMEAFLRAEEKECNVSFSDLGVKAYTTSEFASANEINRNKPYNPMDLIDGDSVASRVVFADKFQHEYIDIELAKTTEIYGAFVETAAEDKGRTPSQAAIKVSDDGKNWKRVDSVSNIKTDRAHLRFKPVSAKFVRFDFGYSTDSTGSRIMEVGVLGK